MFNRGMSLMPKVAITTALSYLYAAYDTRNEGGSWKGYVASAALVVSIVPFTLLAMNPTNQSLISVAKGASALEAASVSELIHKWGRLNLTRSILPLAGALTGIGTFLNNIL